MVQGDSQEAAAQISLSRMELSNGHREETLLIEWLVMVWASWVGHDDGTQHCPVGPVWFRNGSHSCLEKMSVFSLFSVIGVIEQFNALEQPVYIHHEKICGT